MIDAYATASGDFNPIHVDPGICPEGAVRPDDRPRADDARLRRQMLNHWTDGGFDRAGRSTSPSSAPVFAGDTVEVTGEVEEIVERDGVTLARVRLDLHGRRTTDPGGARVSDRSKRGRLNMAREAVIVGVGDVPLKGGKVVGGGSVLQVQARAAKAALDDARIPMGEVDGLLVAGLWGVPGPGQLPSITLGEYLGIIPRFADTTNIGGSAFEAHVAHAAMAIEKGYCDVALIVYGVDAAQRAQPDAWRTAAGADHAVRERLGHSAARRRLCAGGAPPHARIRHDARSSWPRSRSRPGNGRRSIRRRRCATRSPSTT